MVKLIMTACIALLTLGWTKAYVFGLKSADNTVENIIAIESGYNLQIPIVGFIFDTWGPDSQTLVAGFSETLGTGRIYHLTLSPGGFTAKQVASGAYDDQYRSFFETIKKANIKVIFRTMHEMNGGWYSWSSIPNDFKQAWIHVWNLSRQEGLDQRNILFGFSFNHVDMPTKEKNQSHESVLIECKPGDKRVKKCPTFEDYYPGDRYVDLVGVTFYNRGKGNSDRLWLTPNQILNDTGWDTLDRMKQFNKPLFIDEVATTAVNYTGNYTLQQSQRVYTTVTWWKNRWLLQLRDVLLQDDRIVGALYFNRDYTNGLQQWIVGELDRSVIDLETKRVYHSIFELFKSSKKSEALYGLFQTGNVFSFVKSQNSKSFNERVPKPASLTAPLKKPVVIPLRLKKPLQLKIGF